MPQFRIPNEEMSLEESFSDIPDSVRPYILRGFRAMVSADSIKQQRIADYAITSMNSLSELEVDEFASMLEIDTDDAGAIISSLSFLLALVSSRKDSELELVDALFSANLIEPSDREPLQNFIKNLVVRRIEIRRTLSLSRLAQQTLPSFRGLQTSVDLRMGFRKQKVDVIVPIALIHLHTDSDKEEICFQMQKTDVQRVVREFQKVLTQMDEAEKWSSEKVRPAN
ncbi:MAG TPA: hypothetical protein VME86_09795 [Acidobacteriaceae bacterium]|nr:hypothetical protein [Acidobacteriaceae bacterium]